MRKANTIKIDELLSIADFLEETQDEIDLINKDVEAVDKLVMLLIDGGYMTQTEYNEFMESDPILDVYATISCQIASYDMPTEFYKLAPRGVYLYAKKALKIKLDEILKEQNKRIGF